jgi:hypothetical protein
MEAAGIPGALAGGGTGTAAGAAAGCGVRIGSNAVAVGGQIEMHPETLIVLDLERALPV